VIHEEKDDKLSHLKGEPNPNILWVPFTILSHDVTETLVTEISSFQEFSGDTILFHKFKTTTYY
jgi:hypothetical protein